MEGLAVSEPIETCRVCGGDHLEPVLDLGPMPLANALHDTKIELGDRGERFPLALVRCDDCTLVQITETVSPEHLFSDYVYFSSLSDTMVNEARKLVARISAERRFDAHSFVVEIASNDGYLLQHYRDLGVPVLGIEPAANVAYVAEHERHIPTLSRFFTEELADRLARRGVRPDVIHANNVLAHVPDPVGFVRGIARMLRDDGEAVIEVPHVVEMIDRCEFDTIYHEHIAYFSLTALTHLFAKAELAVRDVETLPIHGGSLRLFVGKRPRTRPTERVTAMLERERAWGVSTSEVYAGFARRVAEVRTEVRGTLEGLAKQGRRVAAYGASAKGAMLLNALGIGPELVQYVVDKSDRKQGRMLPGVNVPISDPSRLLEEQPDDVLLLVWNLEAEILDQQAEYRRRGGRFLVPIPSPRFA